MVPILLHWPSSDKFTFLLQQKVTMTITICKGDRSLMAERCPGEKSFFHVFGTALSWLCAEGWGGFPLDPPRHLKRVRIYPQFTEQETEVPRDRSPYIRLEWEEVLAGSGPALSDSQPCRLPHWFPPLLQPAINKNAATTVSVSETLEGSRETGYDVAPGNPGRAGVGWGGWSEGELPLLWGLIVKSCKHAEKLKGCRGEHPSTHWPDFTNADFLPYSL